MRAILRLLVVATATLVVPAGHAQDRLFPGATWMQYATPEEAGFSAEQLAEAHAFWESLPSAAYMVVRGGAVVVAWGDVDRRYMCHSVRKSFLSGLIGVHVDAGDVDLEATLAELGISDIDDGLSETELTATVHDLLKARSGVYRLAAYEPPQNPKPERHAHAPGEFWCYNNWDFNTLLTIFEQETGTKVFEEFQRVFAGPLGMQDFRARDGYYHYELEKSEHPAYPFRMSARDMARYGLLYLNDGEWDGRRILSKEWVDASHHAHTEEAFGSAYGYMWWISRAPVLAELGAYSARGVGGQSIQVLPGADMVIVNRTDTFDGRRVNQQQLDQLARLVLAARTGEPAPEPELVPLPVRPPPVAIELPDELAERICRTWEAGPYGSAVRVFRFDPRDGGGLGLELTPNPGQVFDLWPVACTDETVELLVEGSEDTAYVELDPEDPAADVLIDEASLNRAGYELLAAGRTEAAIEVFERNCRYFPGSANVWDSLGEARMAAGDLEAAIADYERSLGLDPTNQNARDRIAEMKKAQASRE